MLAASVYQDSRTFGAVQHVALYLLLSLFVGAGYSVGCHERV